MPSRACGTAFFFSPKGESGNQELRKREFDFPSTLHHQLSTFCGGIAQLVERQLCKLEVRGSNPLASKDSRANPNDPSGDENLVRPVGRGSAGFKSEALRLEPKRSFG